MSRRTDDYVLVDSFLSQNVPRGAPAVTVSELEGRHRQVCLTVTRIIAS
jgi:hypothetical protein